jgi:hypothetical protein
VSALPVSTFDTLISQLFVLIKLLLLTFSKIPLPKELLSPQPHYLSCSSIIERLKVCLDMEKFPAHTLSTKIHKSKKAQLKIMCFPFTNGFHFSVSKPYFVKKFQVKRISISKEDEWKRMQ